MQVAASADGKLRRASWLASSSLAALMIGGAWAASAACFTGPFPSTNTGALTGICITNQTFSGTVSNAGTITPNGIVVTNSAIGNATAGGQIVDSGTLVGGISIDSHSSIAVPLFHTGIVVTGPTFSGTISNGGTISGGTGANGQGIAGIQVGGVSTFQGAISNSGAITAGSGIRVAGDTSFIGNVGNSGTITGVTGINVVAAGTFVGNITNSATGVISASNTAIKVLNSNVTGSIINAGTISHAGAAGSKGIVINNANFLGGITNAGTGVIAAQIAGVLLTAVGQFGSTSAGGISNAGTIAATVNGISVGAVGVFVGGITNSGKIVAASGGAIQIGFATPAGFAIGPGSFAGGIVNSGTINGHTNAIDVASVFAFTGDIVNSSSGTIAAGTGAGIRVGLVTNGGGYTVLSFSGNISNAGTIAAGGLGIGVDGVSTFQGNVVNTGSIGAHTGIRVANVSAFLGGIANAGTISGGNSGIAVVHVATFTGSIVNAAGATISAAQFGIGVSGNSGTFQGGITNAGHISTTINAGIAVSGVGVFGGSTAGGILNTGTISAGAAGIVVANVATSFGGSITNAAGGAITATSGPGIEVSAVALFGNSSGGGITNAGTITAPTGIKIVAGVTFGAGAAIVNSGTIKGTGGTAIDTSLATSAVTIDQTGGLVSGAIRLSANADVLNVSGGAIAGNIVGQGARDTINFALGTGTFTYGAGFGFSGIHQVNVTSGTVILDGANSATAVTVSGGNLQVGDAASPLARLTGAVDVAGGTLSGFGTAIGGVTIDAGGTLAPGGSTIGTLDITGNLAFHTGSNYAVTLAPTGTNSLTAVTGSASLTGGAIVVTPLLGTYTSGVRTVLTTTGGLGGTTFAGLTINGAFTGTITADYTTNPGDVDLDVGVGSTLPVVVTLALPGNASQNERNVGTAINTFIIGGGTLPGGFQSLAGLSGTPLLTALDQLTGEAGTGFSHGAFQAGSSFLSLMLDPFVDGRSSGVGAAGPLGYAPERTQPAAFASFDKAPRADLAQRYSMWGAAYGGSATAKGDPAVGSHDTASQAFGFAAGVDYRVSPDTVLGIALAGGGTHWSLDRSLGGGRSDMFQAGAFGSTHWGAAYLSGAFAYSFHDVTTDRTATLAGTDRLEGSFRANVLSERVEGGYRFATPWLALTPYAAAQAQTLVLPAYGETATAGSAQFALSYAAKDQTTTRTELGAWLDKSFVLDRGALLTFYGRAAWAHDFGNTSSLSAAFQTLPGANFVVNGAKPAPDVALVTAGARYQLAGGWSLQAKFDGELASTTSIYSGTGVIKKEW
jgi:uncharacterized protein with beta-barrel porin domain